MTKAGNDGSMTAAERTDLARVVRMRAKIARENIDVAVMRQLAYIEAQLAACYSIRDQHWKEIAEEAARKVHEVDQEIARRCRDLGIPEQFRPSLNVNWYGRGVNADKNRRAELRAAAEARLEAAAAEAKSKLLRSEVDLLERITGHGLTSDAAKDFLTTLPTADALLPKLELAELEKMKALPSADDD